MVSKIGQCLGTHIRKGTDRIWESLSSDCPDCPEPAPETPSGICVKWSVYRCACAERWHCRGRRRSSIPYDSKGSNGDEVTKNNQLLFLIEQNLATSGDNY